MSLISCVLSPQSGAQPSALDDTDQDHHNGQYQQEVDETTHRGGRDEPEKPQHEQDYENCPKHSDSPLQAIRISVA
jgi:hypothetical protein